MGRGPDGVDFVSVDTLMGIKVFRQIVESGSFVAASQRLDLSTAMVSKHLMHLEERLGVRLLNRNSRTLSLTEPGRVYFERAKAILDELEATELELGSLSATARGNLRVSAPSWMAGQRLADLLASYRRRWPQVVVDICFEDRAVHLVEDGFDLAAWVATEPDSLPPGLIARRLRPLRYHLAASRTYLEQHGVPRSAEDLAHHAFVAIGNAESLTLISPSGPIEVPMQVVLRYRSMGGVANAVAAGIGMAPLPDVTFEDPVFKDLLVPVLTEHPLVRSTLYLVYVSRKYVPLKIRTFVDHMVEAISALPEPAPQRSSPQGAAT